jgi:lipopolysaccharide biosynthesis glycosyltransferase
MKSRDKPLIDSLRKTLDEFIHIGTGFDKNYLRPFHALMASLIENHPHDRLALHAITEGISAAEKEGIKDVIENAGHRITFYEVAPSLMQRFVLSGQWTSAVYYRLFFSSLLPDNIGRLLYLDCDTVVVKSLRRFYDIDLETHPVGAVYDNFVKTQPHIGIVEEGEYFNSGVLLIDTKAWKSQGVSEKALQYLVKNPEKILFVDQCALNAVLRNNWKKLEPCFNLMYSVLPEGISKKQIDKLLEEAVVIHFTLQRPWHMLCRNRLRSLYFYYLNRSVMKASQKTRYTDFEIRRIPAWLMIRLQEFYFDRPFIQRVWRSLQTK